MSNEIKKKIDEKKLQKAVESWLKKHRASVQDKKLQSVVDDFVKSHRKEVGAQGMKIIRRVIAEGRTKPASKPLTASRSGSTSSNEKPIRAENRRGPSKSTAEKAIKTATDKAKSTVKSATSRVGTLSKLGTGAGLLLVSEPLGGGVDAKDPSKSIKQTERGKKQVPAGEMAMPAPARGGEKGRGDGAAELKARRAAQADKKRVDAATKASKTDAERKKLEQDKKRVDAATKANKTYKNRTYKIKKGDTLSEIARDKGTTVKALAEKNNIKNPDKIYAGRTLKLSNGSVVTRANCGASMKPTQKSSKGVK